ncbi:amino acid adenylation domain-containing protein, partial [Chitinophaga oryziterrae]
MSDEQITSLILSKAEEAGILLIIEEDKLRIRVPKNQSVDGHLLNLIQEYKDLLKGKLLLQPSLTKKVYQKINRRDSTLPGKIPLSFGQERMWFIDHLQGSVQYHMPWLFRIEGTLDLQSMERALREIIQRHEVLRTVIREEDGTGYQIITDGESWELDYMMPDDIISDGFENVSAYITDYLRRPLDLSSDIKLKAVLIRLSEKEHLLCGFVHHIAFDGWSTGILLKELSALYKTYTLNEKPTRVSLPLQYADYANWQRNHFTDEILSSPLAYWKQQLSDIEPLTLPVDHPRTADNSIDGAHTDLLISSHLKDSLQALSRREGVTMFMTLLAVFKILLYRYSRQEDICVGSPVTGRQQDELSGLIGFFLNTLALRTRVNGYKGFRSFLQEVRQTTLDAYQHQDVPFEKVVEQLGIDREGSHNPLFRVMFVLQPSQGLVVPDLEGLTVRAEALPHITSQFDLTLSVNDRPDGLYLSLTYLKDLYEPETMSKMLWHYTQLLESVVADPDCSIEQLRMLSESEEQQLLITFNNTDRQHRKNATIIDLWNEQAVAVPDNIAVVFDDTQLTYRELDEYSNQLAAYLKSKGIERGDLVPVCMESSWMFIISVIGILKAGAAYVPVDPSYPQERVAYILEDIKASIILTTKEVAEALFFEQELILMDNDWDKINAFDKMFRYTKIDAGQLAYIIYTSGSTGRPKGVMIEHGSLLNYVLYGVEHYCGNTTNNAGSFMHLSPTFDASLTALFVPLAAGKTIVIAPGKGIDAFSSTVFEKYAPYDFIKLTPAHLPLLENIIIGNGDLLTHRLVIGGEALYPHHLQHLLDDATSVEIINEYGPTETTVGSSTYVFNIKDEVLKIEKGIPIGRPVNNTKFYVLDDRLQLVPVGVPAELFIGGMGVARGYLNLPELTTKKFITNPFDSKKSSHLYRTGDIVRWLPDGTLEYLGRTDDQVKIRGFRVELDEVTHVLHQAPGVKQAAVILYEEKKLNGRIIGYIVPEMQCDHAAILSWMHERLPGYMVPEMLIELDNIPLTANGKVDKKKLSGLVADMPLTTVYESARTPLEKALTQIWEQLLPRQQIGIHDNFFELGGHSLMAMMFVALVRKRLGKEISVRSVFSYPTIASQASWLNSTEENVLLPAITKHSYIDHIPLSFGQERLWFIDKLSGSIQYHVPWSLRIKGILDVTALENAFRELIRRHEVLRTVILEEDGVGYQLLTDGCKWQLEQKTQAEVIAEGYAAISDYVQFVQGQALDLSEDVMIRSVLVKLTEEEYLLFGFVHHIAFDGWSVRLLLNELSVLYNGSGTDAILPGLAVQYADYAVWQRECLSGEVLEKKLSYWQ